MTQLSSFDRYVILLDSLREHRRLDGWKPEFDRSILSRMEDLYSELDADQVKAVEMLGWRCWPDLYDEKMEAAEEWFDTGVDAARDGATSFPARVKMGGR